MHASMMLLVLALQGGMNQAGPCAPGVQVASDCLGISGTGCCTNDNTVRWCKNGVLCEQSCDAAPACGWKTSAGKYACGSKPKADPECSNPYSCFVDGCAPMWEQAGCCDCGCEACVCQKDPYCCAVAWDAACVDLCRGCGSCGSKDGCAPSQAPGCMGCGCELCVCEIDSYCCTEKWDSLCIQLCNEQCGGECAPCEPDCKDKECGDDGCGGKCGLCAPNSKCVDGQCQPICTKKCSGKQCGPDGCGGSCGTCPAEHKCTPLGKCIYECKPDCTGLACGDDGCGGTCGECPEDQGCVDGQCLSGVCVPQCKDKLCGNDACGGFCGYCPVGTICDDVTSDGDPATFKCEIYCLPDCKNPKTGMTKQCGDDGCGDSCGQCAPGLNCIEGECKSICFPVCDGKTCGTDYCGGSCGTCPPGNVCQEPPGTCVPQDQCLPDCIGKECGPDGCGGSCGNCPGTFSCSFNMCLPNCAPNCLVPPDRLKVKQCGWDECPGQGICGVCGPGLTCGYPYVCVDDKCACTPEMECGLPDPSCPSTCGTCTGPQTCDMETVIDPQTNVCEDCTPTCVKPDGLPKQCGSDGCGGICGGACPPGMSCDEDPNDGDVKLFECDFCVPNCLNPGGQIKQCGDDTCGGICGTCPQDFTCDPINGTCIPCVGQCMVPPAGVLPMECGPNACPTGCMEEALGPCTEEWHCKNAGGHCNAMTGQCVGCGSCGQVCPTNWKCDVNMNDGNGLIYVCIPCIPNCQDKECGDNGCGNFCGTCPAGFDCDTVSEPGKATCVPKCEPIAGCFDKQCGPNGCPLKCMENDSGPDCGPTSQECPEGMQCDPGTKESPHWKCVDCDGGCGTCAVDEYCAEDYKCKDKPNACTGKECGPDGLGGDCGECNEGFECKNNKCVVPKPDEGGDEEVVEQVDVTEQEIEEVGETSTPDDTAAPDTKKEDTGYVPPVCGPCEKLFISVCVPDETKPGCGDDGGGGGGCACATSPIRPPARAAGEALLVAATLLLAFALRKRRGQCPVHGRDRPIP